MNETVFLNQEHEELNDFRGQKITCYYVNRSPQIEVLRVANIQDWYFEKVVFPQQRLTFKSPTQGLLEIYRSELGSPVLVDKLSCQQLEVTP